MAAISDLNDFPTSLSRERFWSLVGHSETGTVEFKESLPRVAKLQEPLVAFANARGGTVVVGVSSKARPPRVVGAPWSQDEEERVQEAARSTQPPLQVQVAAIEVNGSSSPTFTAQAG